MSIFAVSYISSLPLIHLDPKPIHSSFFSLRLHRIHQIHSSIRPRRVYRNRLRLRESFFVAPDRHLSLFVACRVLNPDVVESGEVATPKIMGAALALEACPPPACSSPPALSQPPPNLSFQQLKPRLGSKPCPSKFMAAPENLTYEYNPSPHPTQLDKLLFFSHISAHGLLPKWIHSFSVQSAVPPKLAAAAVAVQLPIAP